MGADYVVCKDDLEFKLNFGLDNIHKNKKSY